MYLRTIFPVVGLLVLGVLHLPPQFVLMDGPEFAIAAAYLGIPHPSGYPLFCQLAHPFTLLPIGNYGLRVAFASLVFGVLAMRGLVWFLEPLIPSLNARWLSALLVFTGVTFLEESLSGEVYSLHLLMLFLTLGGADRWRRSMELRWLIATGFLLGLSFTNHHSMLLALPGLGLLMAAPLVEQFAAIRQHPRYLAVLGLALIGSFMVGSLPQSYLLVRSSQDPVIDRGNPETLANFSEVVLKRVSSSTADTAQNDIANFQRHVVRWQQLFPLHLSVPFFFLSVIGVVLATRRDMTLLACWALVCGVSTLVAMWSFFSASQDIAFMIDPFLMPSFIFFGSMIGSTIHQVLDRVDEVVGGSEAIVGLIAVLLLVSAMPRLFAANKSDDRAAFLWAKNVLLEAPQDALIITRVDELFPLSAMQLLHGMRRDVRVLHQTSLMYRPDDWWLTIPEDARMEYPTQGQAPRVVDAALYQGAVARYLMLGDRRELFLTGFVQDMIPANAEAHLNGLLYRVDFAGREPIPAEVLMRNWSIKDVPAVLLNTGTQPPEDYFLNAYISAARNASSYSDRALGDVELANEFARIAQLLESVKQAPR